MLPSVLLSCLNPLQFKLYQVLSILLAGSLSVALNLIQLFIYYLCWLSHSVMSKPARLLCPWGFSRQEYWRGLRCPSPGDLPNPGIGPRSPTSQADSLPHEPRGKPKDTGVGSLSFLQEIVLTQESNWGIPH